MVQWHWEEISALPAGATLLAGSRSYANQVFRVGDRAWGVQGHPEVTTQIAAEWAREDSPLLVAAEPKQPEDPGSPGARSRGGTGTDVAPRR